MSEKNMKREQFLGGRRKGLGGSDIGAILGLSKLKSPVDLWLDKTGRGKEFESTVPQRFGIYAEEFVAQEYTAKTGRNVVRFNKQLVHPEYDFLIGNIDRLVVPDGAKIAAHMGEIRTDRGMEAKCVTAYSGSEWGDDDSDDVPPYYLTQCAWYRILTGCHFWDLAALIGNHRVEVYTLGRDRELEGLLVARAVEFWTEHVLTNIPPAPRSESDIARLYPKSEEGRKVTATHAELDLIQQIRIERAAIAAAEDRENQAVIAIKSVMQSAEALTMIDADGKSLITWKNNKDSRKTDYEWAFNEVLRTMPDAQLESIKAELLAKYTKTTMGARPFKIK